MWETREAPNGLSFVERGTGEQTERFINYPLPYENACKIEALLAENAWLHEIILKYIGTDASNIDPDGYKKFKES